MVHSRQDLLKLSEQWADWWLTENPLLETKIILASDLETASSVKNSVTETVRFLYLCSVNSSTLTPSLRVDETWHQLLLFTRSYQAFCNAELGRFVHHQPSNQPACQRAQYLATLAFYEDTFKAPDPEFWPFPTTELPGDTQADCGPCES